MRWIALGFVILFAGCAAFQNAPLPLEKKEKVYQADFDRTWHAVLTVLSEEKTPLRMVQKESGMIVTDFDEARTGTRRFQLNILVTPQSTSTKVRVNSRIEALGPRREFGAREWIVEESTGEVEAGLFQKIEKELAPDSVRQ